MTQDFVNIMTTVLTQSFRLLTEWKLPGLNFTPAVYVFGVASFGLGIIFIKGILTVTASGLRGEGHSEKAARASRNDLRKGD